MTRPLAIALLLGACGGSHVAPAEAPRDDREAAVFGADAWRVPGSVDFIGFTGDDMIVATQGGAVVRFARDGARTIIAERALADVSDIAMQGDALLLANETVVRVDLVGGRTTPIDLGRPVSALAVANGRAVVGEGGEGPLRVIDLATRKVLAELDHSRGYVSPQIIGDWVIAGRYQRAAGIWQLATGQRHRAFAVGNSTLYAMSPDRQLIATGGFYAGSQYAVDVHLIDSGERTATVGLTCSPSAVAFSPASDRLALACDDEVHVVKVPSGDAVAKLAGSRSYVRSLQWSPTGDVLALGGNDNALHAWRTDTWQPLSSVTGSRGEIRELAVTGRFLVSHSWGDSSAWLWVTDLVKPAIELGGKGREIFAVAGDGNDILVALDTNADGDRRSSIERWRGVSRVARTSLPSGRFGMSPLVRGLGPVRGGGVWFTAEGRVTILDADLRPRWTSPSSTDPDDPADIGDGYASATKNGATIVLKAGGKLSVISGIERRLVTSEPYTGCGSTPPAVSPDGKRFALLDTKGVFVFDTETAKVVASLGVPTEDAEERTLAWTSDGEILALAGSSLVAWNIAANTASSTPAPNTVSLAVDRQRVYLGRNDGTVARRSIAALRAASTPFALAKPAACEDEPGTYGMSGFGRLGGADEPRGRLDDAGAYDEPDPSMPDEDDEAGSGDD